MEDPPPSESVAVGKRKRSSSALGDVNPPFLPSSESSNVTYHILQGHNETHPLPKRPKLPPKPPSPVGRPMKTIQALPPSILQHILAYLDPVSLARSMLVNRKFRLLLDERLIIDATKHEGDVYSTRTQDAVWSDALRLHLPSMPRPLASLSVRSQCTIIFGDRCQFCGKNKLVFTSTSSDPWRAGPGCENIRTIWPFRIRSCTACLLPKIRKDSDVILSEASPLIPGLPFALFTQSMDFVSQALVRSNVPYDISLQKYYFLSDIEALQEKLSEARSLAQAAAEEWLKGLPHQGKSAQNDATRFEQWELNGGLVHARSILRSLRHAKPVFDSSRVVSHQVSGHLFSSMPIQTLTELAPLPIASALPPLPSYGLAPGLEPPRSLPDIQSDTVSRDSQKSTGTQKQSKSSRERARIRAHRKAEIIARCQNLEPPITKDMLERLDAFDAALMVNVPLNDAAWDTLRGRLLQERHKVFLEDQARRLARTAPVPGIFKPPERTDEYVLAHAETPRRQKLCKIAEEFIKQKWGYGAFVAYPNAPKFAAEVLIHTRQAYLDEEARVARLQVPTGLAALSLSQEAALKLEDMKWVFEQTIKPRTEQIRKDLFLCPICPDTGMIKHFAFESIIQHYASKHTTSLSNGPQKVSWKADWPDIPPFHDHPERVHTPSPSITHTPTMSQRQLPAVSPQHSVLTSTVSSGGWHTPDTMSLVSNTTRGMSISGASMSGAYPGKLSLEKERVPSTESLLSTAFIESWTMTSMPTTMPHNLRLHLTVLYAISKVKEVIGTWPTLELLENCVNTRSELRIIDKVDTLECAECLTSGRQIKSTMTLRALLLHFKEYHLSHNHASSKCDWRTDMIALPSPIIVKNCQNDAHLHSSLVPLLAEAHITSTLQAGQIVAHIKQFSPKTSSHGRVGDEISRMQEGQSQFPYHHTSMVSSHNDLRIGHRRTISSTAPTYAGSDTMNDTWSSSSRTVDGDDNRASERYYKRAPPAPSDLTSISLPNQQPNEAVRRASNNVYTSMAGEMMTRSNTVRSHHSRNDVRPGENDSDLLSAIDAHVDVEMANSNQPQLRNLTPSWSDVHPDRPSRSNRTADVHDADMRLVRAPIETEDRYESHMSYTPSMRDLTHSRSSARYEHFPASALGNTALTRLQSRVVEFDHHGTPVSHEERVYHGTLPSRGEFTYQGPDNLSQPRSTSSPSLNTTEQEINFVNRSHMPSDQDYVHHRYQPIDQVTTSTFRPHRIYDSATGQYYVAERPAPRQYIEIGEAYPRVQTLYDEYGRPLQYREVDPRRYTENSPEHESIDYVNRPPSG